MPKTSICTRGSTGGEKVRTDWVNDSDYETDFYRASPEIGEFSAEPTRNGVRLRWSVRVPTPDTAPTELIIEPEVGFLASDESAVVVRPAADTVYTFAALDPKGTNTATVAVKAVQ